MRKLFYTVDYGFKGKADRAERRPFIIGDMEKFRWELPNFASGVGEESLRTGYRPLKYLRNLRIFYRVDIDGLF